MSAVVVVRPGLLTTVQDLGRWGSQSLGIPVAGPMDTYSHRLANLLVDNPAGLATLEVTLIGPELQFERSAVLAVTGGEFDVTLNDAPVPFCRSVRIEAGQRLRFGRRRFGARAYLAVGGGFDTPAVAGSRATNTVCAMGGHEGRALRVGDRLRVGPAPSGKARDRRAAGLAVPQGRTVLRVMAGPQAEWFPPTVLEGVCRDAFRVSPRSNRMGYRLEGAPILHIKEGEPVSEPVPMGAIQVPPAGEPILLMADRQTVGGYPKVATVISADLPLAAQLAPGDLLTFRACTRRDAVAALIARERQILHVTDHGALA